MNWEILATGTIAAKFAETVNGMKGRTDWRPAVPFPGEGGGFRKEIRNSQDIRFL